MSLPALHAALSHEALALTDDGGPVMRVDRFGSTFSITSEPRRFVLWGVRPRPGDVQIGSPEDAEWQRRLNERARERRRLFDPTENARAALAYMNGLYGTDKSWVAFKPGALAAYREAGMGDLLDNIDWGWPS